MSRHRNVRSMNYSEECEGFDDVYGHSVEDDHCISPSEARFLYDRTRHPQMSAFINEENYIAEEDEHNTINDPDSRKLDKLRESGIDEDKLRTCVDDIQNVIGDMVPQSIIEEVVLKYDYDVQRSLNHILNENEALGNTLLEEPLPQKDIKIRSKDKGGGDGPGNRVHKFVIPKLKSVHVERLERGVQNMQIFEGNVINNFSSLQTLMEHHQKATTVSESDCEVESRRSSFTEKSHHSTLEEFSKSFLTKKTPSDNPSLPTDEIKPSFVIPKLKKKTTAEISDDKWLIDLSSALNSDLELKSKSQRMVESSSTELTEDIPPYKFENVHSVEANLYESHISKENSEVSKKDSSPFGKILCRKWKCNEVTLIKKNSSLPSRVVHFDFSAPSPDDLILKYIRRK